MERLCDMYRWAGYYDKPLKQSVKESKLDELPKECVNESKDDCHEKNTCQECENIVK